MIITSLREAARGFVDLVAPVPADRWDGPGLGAWDLRALVGHTARSLITVEEYLTRPADRVDCARAADYYTAVRAIVVADPDAVVERGRRAGADLGRQPAAAVEALAERVLPLLEREDDPLITTLAGGMRLSDYLPTRLLELVVHSYDIAAALEVDPPQHPPETLRAVLDLLTASALAQGTGPAVLLALTGRRSLSEGFSLV